MSKSSTFIYSLYLAVCLHISVATDLASATKLNAPPLPHASTSGTGSDHDFANGEEVIIPPSATSFKRRPDYRELEKMHADAEAEKAKKAEEDKKAAQDNALKNRQDQINAYNSQIKQATEFNNQAVQFGKQGRWIEAIDAHEKAVQYDPRNKQFRVNLSAARTAYGQQKLTQKDYAGAASLFRKALAAAPDNGLAGKCLADALKKSGIDPGVADNRITVGDQLAAAGDLAGAAIEYQAAMTLDPSAKIYVKMGDMSYRYGQASQAGEYFRQAVIKDPDYAPAHRQLGFLQLAAKDTTSAAASLRKALICDPKDVAAGTALTDIWRKQVAANPSLADNHIGLAGAMQLTGDFVGADTELRKAEAIEPNNAGLAPAKAVLGHAIQHANAEKYKSAFLTLFNQGLAREALAEIKQATAMEPKNANYQYLLGECLERNGDYAGAHQAYLNCVLIDPEKNQEAASRMKAMEGMAQQQAVQAPPQQQAPRQQAAQSQPPAYRQGMQLQRPAAPYQGQPAQAAVANPSGKNMYEGGSGSSGPAGGMTFRTHDESAAAQAATASDAAAPQKPMDTVTRLNMAESQKDYASAITILQELVSSNLQNADMHHRLAVDLMSAGQMQEAISEFRIASALNTQKKEYADDLARAMAIHKRSLSTGGSGVPQ